LVERRERRGRRERDKKAKKKRVCDGTLPSILPFDFHSPGLFALPLLVFKKLSSVDIIALFRSSSNRQHRQRRRRGQEERTRERENVNRADSRSQTFFFFSVSSSLLSFDLDQEGEKHGRAPSARCPGLAARRNRSRGKEQGAPRKRGQGEARAAAAGLGGGGSERRQRGRELLHLGGRRGLLPEQQRAAAAASLRWRDGGRDGDGRWERGIGRGCFPLFLVSVFSSFYFPLPSTLWPKKCSSLSLFLSPLQRLPSSCKKTAAGAVAVAVLGVFGVFQMAGAVARGTGRSLSATEQQQSGGGGGGGGAEGGVRGETSRDS
jgi:hypothetical protein